jgi:hypothetical protein
MKQIILLLLYCACTISTFGQPKNDKASVMIIGTIHTGNKTFDHRYLYQKLQQLKPDVILWEFSTPYNKVFGLRTAHFLKLAKPGIEQLALQKYVSKYKGCKVLPFDTLIPDRRKYQKDIVRFSMTLHDSLSSISKNNIADSAAIADFETAGNTVYSQFPSASLEYLNHPDFIEKTRRIFNLQATIINPLLVKSYPDTELTKWYLHEAAFRELRNSHMAKQIIRMAELHKGKKIVILTGLFHKYILSDKLREAGQGSYTILPFPEDK